jgi:hypothetical protein
LSAEHSGARLVVTGHAADQSVFVSDAVAPELQLAGPSVRACFLWGRDRVAVFPDRGLMPTLAGPIPPPGGCRFSTLTIEAGANLAYHNFVVAALGPLAEASNPGFHATPTLDFVVILAGELSLEVDQGGTRVLRQGDFAVINGGRHRWRNCGDTAATLAAVMIGALSRVDPASGTFPAESGYDQNDSEL